MNYDKEWYESLIKPDFQPPAWVFPPVWGLLYLLIATAFLVVVGAGFNWKTVFAAVFFTLQLFVNFQWPVAFFKEHDLRKAFLICSLLTLLVFVTLILFFRVSLLAGFLFLPYFCWCVFATILNFFILELNEW